MPRGLQFDTLRTDRRAHLLKTENQIEYYYLSRLRRADRGGDGMCIHGADGGG